MGFPHQNMAQQHVATSLDHHPHWSISGHDLVKPAPGAASGDLQSAKWWSDHPSQSHLKHHQSPWSQCHLPRIARYSESHIMPHLQYDDASAKKAMPGLELEPKSEGRCGHRFPRWIYTYIYIFIITRVGFTTPSGTWQWTIGHLYRYFPHEHLGLTLWFSSHIWFSRGQLGRCQATLWRMASSISADSVNGCRREVLARRFPEAERGSKIQLGWGFIGNCHGDLMVVSPIYGNHGAFPSGDLT